MFVAVDIPKTPESPVLKVAFVVVTLFTGPIGAFLYVLGCREPLPGLHERYTAARWRQTVDVVQLGRDVYPGQQQQSEARAGIGSHCARGADASD